MRVPVVRLLTNSRGSWPPKARTVGGPHKTDEAYETH